MKHEIKYKLRLALTESIKSPMCNIMTVNTYEKGINYLNQYIGTREQNPEAWAKIEKPLKMWKDITIQIRDEIATKGMSGDSEVDESDTWWSAIISRFCK
jgi:hypothetical protein